MFSLTDLRSPSICWWWDSPPAGVKVMEKADDEESPGATGGEGDGRDTTSLHNTSPPDGMADILAMLQVFMLNQQQEQMQQIQQQNSQLQKELQQQMHQQISQLQEEVQKGKKARVCFDPSTSSKPRHSDKTSSSVTR